MFLGEKKIKSTTKKGNFIEVEFEKIGKEQPKMMIVSKELLDWCETEKEENDAETKFKERRINFYSKVIIDLLDKTDFFKGISNYILDRDNEKLSQSRNKIVQKIADEIYKHNIPLMDWHDVCNQVNGLVAGRINSIKGWLEETFTLNTHNALKKLFNEGEHDIRTFHDVHKLQ